MNETNTKEQNTEICSKLYNNDLITFEKYLECTGQSNTTRTPNISDKHKYSVVNKNFNKNNIYNKELNIYSSHIKEPLYLAVISNSGANTTNITNTTTTTNATATTNNVTATTNTAVLTLTSGIIQQDDNIFVIEKIDDSRIAIKHQSSGKYIAYNIPKLELTLTDNKTIKTNFILKSFLINGILKYKFILLKQGGIESDYSFIIKNGKLTIERDSIFTWDINNLEYIDTHEVDYILDDINHIQDEYNTVLYKYNVLDNKIHVLNNIVDIITGGNGNINNAFNNLKRLQTANLIQISDAQLESSYNDTINLLNQNELSIINNKVEELNSELALTETDLEMYKNKLNDKINDIQIEIEERKSELNTVNNKIQQYNSTLMNNNIVVDINKFNDVNNENSKNILKSEINKDIGNKFNNKKTRVNAFFIIIICVLLLIIIIQISYKVITIKSRA